jgi:predicted Zn-ribbon and HTH transcriptional regulator
MTSTGFWERKVARIQQEKGIVPPQPVNRDAPWWNQVPVQQTPQAQPQQTAGHDFTKALHLKQESNCPECGSGNFMKSSPSSARRCFDCGYVDGRSISDPNRPLGMTSDGSAGNKARQTQEGGARTDNYHGNITTASQAAGYIGVV